MKKPVQKKTVSEPASATVQKKASGKSAPAPKSGISFQLKSAVPVNDDPSLEKEADTMGAKALQRKASPEEEEKH